MLAVHKAFLAAVKFWPSSRLGIISQSNSMTSRSWSHTKHLYH
jgi:hypothetical protein